MTGGTAYAGTGETRGMGTRMTAQEGTFMRIAVLSAAVAAAVALGAAAPAAAQESRDDGGKMRFRLLLEPPRLDQRQPTRRWSTT